MGLSADDYRYSTNDKAGHEDRPDAPLYGAGWNAGQVA
jgi:hypothetical protein